MELRPLTSKTQNSLIRRIKQGVEQATNAKVTLMSAGTRDECTMPCLRKTVVETIQKQESKKTPVYSCKGILFTLYYIPYSLVLEFQIGGGKNVVYCL